MHHWFHNGYRPTSFFFGTNEPITVTDFNCLGINSGVSDTDLVVLSTVFSRAYDLFLSQRLPLPTSILPELITVTDTETDADLTFFKQDHKRYPQRGIHEKDKFPQ